MNALEFTKINTGCIPKYMVDGKLLLIYYPHRKINISLHIIKGIHDIPHVCKQREHHYGKHAQYQQHNP